MNTEHLEGQNSKDGNSRRTKSFRVEKVSRKRRSGEEVNSTDNMLTDVEIFPPGLTEVDVYVVCSDGEGKGGGDGSGTTIRVRISDSDFFNRFEDDFDDADIN